MKISLNKDTLAYQIGMRPALQHRDMSNARLVDVVKSLNGFYVLTNIYNFADEEGPTPDIVEGVMGSPEVDAIAFYLMNHSVAIVRKRSHVYSPLGSYLPLVQRYHTELAARAARMFFYLLLICTRESRHEHTQGPFTSVSEITKFHKGLKGIASLVTAERFMTGPPDVTLGQYTVFLADCFNTGKFSSSYGGKAWGKIAEVLRDYVNGKLTAEMMIDTSFTLAHNNGPIFNKGMLFNAYSPEIYKILDVQRSGQIPEYVKASHNGFAKVPLITDLLSICEPLVGSEFGAYVDWFAVEELGSVKKYPSEKNIQIGSVGYPSNFKAKQEAQAAKKEAAAVKTNQALKSQVEIFPGIFIQKVEVVR